MTQGVDYDRIADSYDRRYADYVYDGIEGALLQFAHGATRPLEVGCGTGHWLERLRQEGHAVAGLDASEQMLAKARARLPELQLTLGRAEALPFPTASFDRLFCMHAFHHFDDRSAFLREAQRVLVPGGELLIIGLDPHTGHERFWIYDYYPGALERDRERYPAHADLRALIEQHGFVRARSWEAQRMLSRDDVGAALTDGKLAKTSTSQLALLTDAEYTAGIARVRANVEAAAARGEALHVDTELHLYATTAVRP